MDPEQKKRIMIRYLQENSIDKIVDISNDALKSNDVLEMVMNWLEQRGSGLFDVELENSPEQWSAFKSILDHSLQFKRGSPPEITGFSTAKLQERIDFYRQVPDCDFYTRPTAMAADEGLTALVNLIRAKLRPLIERFLPKIDLNNNDEIQSKIEALSSKVKKEKPDRLQKSEDEQLLNLLNDFNKINRLQGITIPQGEGQPLAYCTLAESAGGVTEKISLITRDEVERKLLALSQVEITTLEEYEAIRKDFKLSTKAILKLPKHGHDEEVQREAMALHLSIMLGLKTAKSTMVSHEGRPALFVPFDDIHLLSEVSSGKTKQALLFSLAKYTDESTIDPVGEGLQSERFIDDFGNSIGLLYLCNDTDAVGGYNQNKAIDSEGNLYVFDLVVKPGDNLELDSRLSLTPIGPLKHTRHGVGRNKTLIEDASIDQSFKSFMKLKHEQVNISKYCERIAHTHHDKILQLEASLGQTRDPTTRKVIERDIKRLKLLEQDALRLGEKMDERIDKIDSILLNVDQTIDPILLEKMRVLELLINRPRLFTDDGRPYRYPWTSENSNPITRVQRAKEHPGCFEITFASAPPVDVLRMIQREKGAGEQILIRENTVLMDEASMLSLEETMLFPERKGALMHGVGYLIPKDLKALASSYGVGHRGKMIAEIKSYLADMGKDHLSTQDKLERITLTEERLIKFIDTASDKGFGKHILQKFYFDAQQRMQNKMEPDLRPAMIDEAFNAALKLDQLSTFNSVVQVAMYNNKLNDPLFLEYLVECCNKADRATDHFSAIKMSRELASSASMVIAALDAPDNVLADIQQQVVQASVEGADNNVFEEWAVLFSQDPLADPHTHVHVTL